MGTELGSAIPPGDIRQATRAPVTPPAPPADHHGLRDVLARFASGVTITTTRRVGGEPIGITASSFSALSLEPALVLVCVARSTLSFPFFNDCAGFGISILAEGQADVALRYATAGALKFTDEDHFVGAASGVPLIHGALAHIECERYQSLPGGDHIILIGRVVHSARTSGRPLLNFNRTFGEFIRASRDERDADD
ncbi:flavin reductase family protein [Actinomadura madurae]|uniref:flavin reductase family protein n=1 Tax=Actinomadura madurae TaxID=1993 RepID=UPI00202751FA|nr:flavin reductase family protein [Actinomadura madurae]URM95543.1 flavin reductase family protein [Actinomadura madurae]